MKLQQIKNKNLGGVWGFHGGEVSSRALLYCDAV